MPAIETPRLRLVAASNDVLQAELDRGGAVAALLGADAPQTWPPDENYDANAIRYVMVMQERDPESREWGFRYFLLKGARPLLIGTGGFAAPPADGEVELGYAIVPEYRGQGLASEAVEGLVMRAFSRLDVARVIAHTLPALVSSIGVLTKCGFSLDGPGKEAGTVRYVRTRA